MRWMSAGLNIQGRDNGTEHVKLLLDISSIMYHLLFSFLILDVVFNSNPQPDSLFGQLYSSSSGFTNW